MSDLLKEFGAATSSDGASSAQTAAPDSGEKSLLGRVASDIGTGITELVPAVGSGIVRGVNEMSQAAFEAGQWLNKNVADLGTVEIGRGGLKWRSGYAETNDLQVPESVQPPRPTTVTGSIGEGVSQFLTGYVLGGKLLKGAGMTAARFAPAAATSAVVDAAATTGGKLAYAGARSMFSGATAFDPSEERLSNFINEDTPLGNALTEYLATSPDDSRAEGRFKNALENVILDVPLEAFFYAVKGIKAKRAGDTKAAEVLAEQVEKELNKATTSTEAVPREGADVPEINFGKSPRGPRKATSVYEPAPERPTADGKSYEPYKPPFDWGEKQADALLERYGKIADDPQALDAEAKRRLFTNMRYVADENDAKALFNEFGKIAYQSFVKSRGDKITHADVLNWAGKQADELADVTGTDVRELVLRMNADKADIDGLAQRLAGYRAATSVYSRRATDLANAFKRGDLSEFGGDMNAWKSEFLRTTQTLFAIAPQTEGIKSGLGRNLALLQANIGPDGKPTGKLAGMSDEAAKASRAASPKAQVEGKAPDVGPVGQAEVAGASAGDDAAIQRLVEKLARTDNPKAAKKVVEDAFGAGAMDVNNELWINALLSGPKTHIVNMMTSTLKSALVMPGEQMLAGIISRDMDLFMMGADQYAGFFHAMKDSMRMARKALAQGDPVLDVSSQGYGGAGHGGSGVINAGTFGLNTETPLGALVSGFGQLVRMPSRLLTSEDELLKQLNYRARLYAMGVREAREMRRAHKATDAELSKFISEYVERGFDENGAAVNAEALAWARDATFTNDLSVQTWGGGKSIGESLNAFAASHPGFRMVMPFIRVPTNIMRDVWDHTPGMNLLRRQYRAELEAGGERAALAKAKMLTGSGIMTTAVMMAANGDIVGGLASDPAVRKAQQEAGVVPFSIRVRQEDGSYRYYSYERFDPYATFFSTVATFADIAGHIDDWKMEDLASSMVTALAKNIESKTYLQGITEILGAISDPDSKAEAFLKKRAASYVPSITNAFRGADYLSDPHTIAQAMQARTAGYGNGVDPRYNLIGERVATPKGYGPDWLSPITVGQQDDPVLMELARLVDKHKGGLGYPSKTRSGGLDLDLTQFAIGDQSAYGRMQELAGEVKVSGKTLRSRLDEMFSSDRYKNKLTDGEPGIPGSRLTHVQATIEAYRQAALAQLSKESPEFGQAYRDAQIKRVQMQRFGPQQ
ncbi:MAG: hypothetical protein EPO10_14620 [Reyranella sp.]|uniref:hypothetical protein n=1 Tax=Reyranella sp. TaxID=1929291 RepID=UPI00121336E9|nr:hypothetical protein [Reyranella sp.]TAJ97153.1 MAG: hypothetical protein EPO41_03945 [Reyranella sp.]TBR28128.1 MAG: hypothetical protein EPO10_14620 [Reyranella sp.]